MPCHCLNNDRKCCPQPRNRFHTILWAKTPSISAILFTPISATQNHRPTKRVAGKTNFGIRPMLKIRRFQKPNLARFTFKRGKSSHPTHKKIPLFRHTFFYTKSAQRLAAHPPGGPGWTPSPKDTTADPTTSANRPDSPVGCSRRLGGALWHQNAVATHCHTSPPPYRAIDR